MMSVMAIKLGGEGNEDVENNEHENFGHGTATLPILVDILHKYL